MINCGHPKYLPSHLDTNKFGLENVKLLPNSIARETLKSNTNHDDSDLDNPFHEK